MTTLRASDEGLSDFWCRPLTYLFVFILLLASPLREAYAGAESDFYIFTVDTNVADGSPAGQFIMPSSDSNYQLQWEAVGNEAGFNSGGFIQITSANQVIDFGAPGVYRIKVDPVDVASGVNDFDTLVINTDPMKFISVEQWGTAQWTPGGLKNAFRQLPNFTGFTATDAPDLTNVTSLYYTFYKTPLLVNTVGIETWDVSNILNLAGTFRETALANPNVSTWDTSKVTTMYETFRGTGAANPDTSGWNTSSVLELRLMFYDAQMANPDTSGWDTSLVTNMSGMFYKASSANPDTSGWDTSAVTRMEGMFQAAPSANPDTSGWDTSAVTRMDSMFSSAISANPDTSGWDTSSVTSMSYMFSNASIADPDTSAWNTSLVTNMQRMFYRASVANPDTSGWDTSNVTMMEAMFFSASLATPDTSTWNTSSVTRMDGMFSSAASANPNTSGWDTSSVTNMHNMFNSASLANPNTSGWNTALVQSMYAMFYNAKVANPNTSGWDTSLVTSMDNMFSYAALANPDTSGWNTSNVTRMYRMFLAASTANPDTSNWDTSSVISFEAMFQSAHAANPDTSSWDTSSATTMNAMFYDTRVANPDTSGWDTSSLTNLQNTFGIATIATPDTSNWDVSNVTNMYRTFIKTPLANPDTSGWDTSSVTNMEGMFYEAAIATPDTSGWDTSSVTDMSNVFYYASMADPDTSGWDTSSVVEMDNLFSGAAVADPDVSGWNVSNVTDMTGMFRFSGPKSFDLSNWDTSQVTTMHAMFRDVVFTENADLSGLDFDSVTDTQDMFYESTMTVAQVDAVLTKLDSQTLNPNLTIHFGSNQYCLGESARDSIIDNDGWSISDGGKNCTVANLQEILEDSASGGGTNNGNSTSVTADQLAGIVGLTGVDPANESEYQALIAAEAGLSNPPTVAEVQALIDAANDSVNALAEILEDSSSTGGANDTNGTAVTAAQLAGITGITGVDPANEAEYQALIANATNLSNPPTVAEVQALIDTANDSVNALAEILEDSGSTGGANDTNGTAVTAAQLAAITGLTGVDPANEAEYQDLIANAANLSNPPTVAEVQALIDAANDSVNALAEILEDSSSTGGANDTNGTAVTAAQLAGITGITGVDPANEAEYQALIANATNLSNPPTVAEVQALIDTANDSVNALAEIVEDSSSTGGANDTNGTAVTAAQLAGITGITGVDPANEAEYQALIANATNLSNPPTVAEVQALIDAANDSVNALAEILEDSSSTGGANDTNGTAVTAAQLSGITGITGVDPANEAEYQALIANATNLSNPPAVAEVQALIDAANDSVNALAEILEDSSSTGGANDTNGTAVTAAQLAGITGITGVDPANEAEYQALIANATNLSNPPTVAEVQALIDAANESVNSLAGILEDSNSVGGGNNADATPVTAAQLAAITGLLGVDPTNEAQYQALIAAETGFSNPPTVAEVQALIDVANGSVAVLAEILEYSLSTGGPGDTNGTPVTAAQLSVITGIAGVDPANEAEYQELIANAANLSNPPTLAEVQELIDEANASVNAFAQILESSSSTGGSGDSDGSPVSAAQLAQITGITGVDPANESAYQALIASAMNLSSPPTLAEVQALIDEANTSESILLQVSAASNGGAPVTAAQLSSISGVEGVNPDNETAYQALMATGEGVSTPPTAEEVQRLIDSVNDADGDGLSDLIEQGVDTDNDGVTDEHDLDTDNDGIRDQDEGAVDSDGDGVPNFRDLDSDNDGIFDWNESNADTQLISEQDSDRNGVIDAINVVGSNGLVDAIENTEQAGELIYTLSDVDGDGVADYLDRDSDNDGLFDSIEAGNTDANLDGAIDDGFAPGTFDDGATQTSSALLSDENGVLTGEGSAPRDTDQDTVPDYRDVDSDNDGMSDVLESFGASVDQDQDGRLDSFVDSDGDGVSDSLQGASQAANDTDGDGQLDAVDTDSDGDGIADLVENGMQDIDGDGQLDDFVDRDGDGLDDGFEVIATEVLDLDGDGVPNYKDLDSDGDGFSDLEESGGVDANGDGSADTLTLGAALPDSDNDGIPDHLQTTYAGAIVTGQGWGGSGGCSVASVRSVVQTGSRGVRVDPVFILMSVLSLLWLVSRRRRVPKANEVGVSVNHKLIFLATLVPLFSTGCSVLHKPASAELAGEGPSMSKQWYASAGVGFSRMKPDTSGVPGVGVDDQVDSGVQLSVGADIRPRLSLELHTSDLGASGLSSGDEIAYRVHAGSALLYVRERSNEAKAAGLNAYARLGAGVLENTASGSVVYEQENQVQLLLGAGVEYAMGSSVSVRAEAVAFEQAVQYGQVGLVYRFGGSKRGARSGEIAAADTKTTTLEKSEPLVLSAAKVVSGESKDLLTQRLVARAQGGADSEPAMGAAMAKCHSASNVKVYFDVNSAQLKADQIKQLDGLADALSGCERARIELLGHADNTGSAQLNEALSYRRAQAVVKYLTAQGIGSERTRIKALGETQPAQSNATATGRQNNRRVAFNVY